MMPRNRISTESIFRRMTAAPYSSFSIVAARENDSEETRAVPARAMTAALIYIFAYWVLSWVGALYAPAKFDITPWNPAVGASVLLLLLRDMRYAPLVFAASFSSGVFIKSNAPDLPLLAFSLGETCVYSLAAWLLRGRFRISPKLDQVREAIYFCTISTLAAGMAASLYALTHYYAGTLPQPDIAPVILKYWASDAVGMMIIVPLGLRLLAAAEFRPPRDRIFTLAYAAKILLTVALASVIYIGRLHNMHASYLMFVPIIWTAVDGDVAEVAGTLLILLLTSLFYCWRFAIEPRVAIDFLPFFMLSLAWTGYVVAALVGERAASHVQIVKGNARMRALLDMSPDCLVIVDLAHNIVATNRNFATLCGADTADLVDHPIETVLPRFSHELNGETSMRLADKTFIPVDVSALRVPIGDGKFSSILTVRDIAMRKQAESEQRQRRSVSEQATRMHLTGGLAAALSHELNQPLAAIMSYITACRTVMAQNKTCPDKAFEHIEKASAQAMRAANIIRRLREFYHNSKLEIVPVPVVLLIDETLEFLEDEIARTNTAVKIDAPETLVAAIDYVQIEQVLINLIRNSLEALKEKPVDQREIRLGAQKTPDGIEVTVRDNGPGIPGEIADKLFSPFVTTRTSGMGLGLVNCHSIIEAHGGRIWAEALPSASGTALHFTLPVYEKETEES